MAQSTNIMAALIFFSLLLLSAGLVSVEAYIVMIALIGSLTIYLQQNEKKSSFLRKLIFAVIAFPITLAVTYFFVKVTIRVLS